MFNSKILDDISARIEAAIAASPARDVQKNLKAVLTNSLNRLDLVSREDFDIQAQLLARTREKLDALEAKVKAMEDAKELR